MRHSGRPAARTAAIVLAAVGLMGMGGFGGGGESRPALHDYRATFTDVDGTRTSATNVSAGGEASLEGELGRGRLRVPFDNIARITFQPSKTERDRLRAELQLREGEPIVLTLRSSTTFYGRIPGGAYQIRARDLQSVDFEE